MGVSLVHREPQAAVRLQKSLSVRRSDEDPARLWWSLPLSLRQFRRCFAAELQHADALVRPPAAVDSVDAVILSVAQDEGAQPAASRTADSSSGGATSVQLAPERLHRRVVPEGTLCFRDVPALLELVDQGRVAPCRIRVHPDGAAEARFHIDIPEADSARAQFLFEQPGDAVRALESLALGRRFGNAAANLETSLCRCLESAPEGELALRLVLEHGAARLESTSSDGRRRTCHLHSVEGRSGEVDVRSRWDVWRETSREWRRRFPVNVILFAGLPLFIAFFRVGGAIVRRLRP